MKRTITLCMLVLVSLSLLVSPVFSVELKRSPAASTLARGDLNVSVRLVGGKGSVLRPGRDIRLTFQTNKDAYVVIYNIDSEGYINLLFPNNGTIKKVRGRTVHYLPDENSGVYWEAGGKTGIEYIHAVAVSDLDRLKEDEIYFLAQNRKQSEEKRFRIDMDPFLAFNMIDEELLVDSGQELATDYTYFYVNRKVDYPRYLCAKCHGHDDFNDPYAEDCPEIVIEKLAYEEDLEYPYPEAFAVRDVDEDYYSSKGYADRRTEDRDDYDNDTKVYLSIYYSDYDYPYWYSGSYFRYHFASYADPFWWDYGWNWHWSNNYYFHWPFYSWYHPYYFHWAYNHHWNNWWYDHHGRYDRYYGHRTRSIHADRRIAKRNLSYASLMSRSNKTRTLARSSLVKKRIDTARTLDRTRTGRRTIERSRLAERISRGRETRARTIRTDRTSARTRDVKRRIIYNGSRTQRSRDADETRRAKRKSSSRVRSGTTRKQGTDRTVDRNRSSSRSKSRRGSSSSVRKDRSTTKRKTPPRIKSSPKSRRSSGTSKRTVNRPSSSRRSSSPARSTSRSSSRSSRSSGGSSKARKR